MSDYELLPESPLGGVEIELDGFNITEVTDKSLVMVALPRDKFRDIESSIDKSCGLKLPEKDAFNPVETYKRDDDGTIATTFTFNKGSLDGPTKVFQPRGFVMDETTNAIWGMQFVWPIKADYRIVYLDDQYQQTIIGRNSRDYVWIMARTPSISEQDYTKLVGVVKSLGYELDALQKAIHAK